MSLRWGISAIMKEKLLQIASYGIRPGTPADIVEQTKLVNLISFLGVPISATYVLLFAITGHTELAIAFFGGIIIFGLPLFLNKWFGLPVGRLFVVIMSSVVFGSVTIIAGREAGFYLGFLVICVPPIIIYPDWKRGIFFMCLTAFFLAVSLAVTFFIPPLSALDPSFEMGLYIFNLFTVLATSIAVVVIYKTELDHSRKIIQEKNSEIISSINYAKRIQYTLLAHQQLLDENLEQHFVLFKPKDIVSGDFYWATKRDDRFYLAVCDCTGHGVPGAFMSLLNITFLNEAINEKNIREPHEILNHVRRQLIDSISKEGGRDGMDAILLCFEKDRITYAAANNAPVLVRKNEPVSLDTDKMPVGKGEKDASFTLRTIDAQAGDFLFLYTDGYADQFGGPNGKKFKYKTLNNLLAELSAHSPAEQRSMLEKRFTAWQGELEQVDDVCVIGLRI
jgi:serine phosphatase RsbU (regulator of sigma subunit)